MKKWGAFFFLMLMAWHAVLPAVLAEGAEAERAEADAFFTALFEKANVVGGAALVAQGGEHVYSLVYGYRDRKRENPVTEDTVFKVASVTKMVTALGVMRLAEEGKIGLDAPLGNFLSGPIVNPYHPEAAITLRQVMSHTSSISGSAAYARAPAWDRIEAEDGYFTRSLPGTRYEYANLNGGILGSLIEGLSGQSLNTYMTEQIFAPLRINAAYAATLLPDAAPLSNTFNTERGTYMTAENYLANDAAYDDTCNPAAHYRASVGSLYISASGLEKIGMMLAGEGETGGVRILNPATVHEMELDQRLLPGSTVTGESPYGLSLYRAAAQDGTIWYGHQGRWEGLVADVFYEKGTRTVLVLILNGTKRDGNGEICRPAQNAIDFLTGRLAPLVEDETGYWE